MTSLSIKSALIGVLGLLTVCLAGLGYISIVNLSHIDENVRDYDIRIVPAVYTAGAINSDLAEIRYREAEHILAKDATGKQAKEADIAKAMDNLNTHMGEFEKVASGPYYDKFKAKWVEYLAQHKRLIEISRRNEIEAANQLYAGELGAIHQDANGLIDQVVSRRREEAHALAKSSDGEYASAWLNVSIALGLGLLIAAAGISYGLFGISGPLQRITGAMTRLAGGDTASEIPYVHWRNEVGRMAGATLTFRDNMVRARALEAEAASAKQKAEAERRAEMLKIADGFERAVGGIVRIVSDAAVELQAAAQSLSASSSQTSLQSTTVAAASEQAASNVNTVAAAAEELAGSVREIMRQMHQSSQMANKAVKEAEQTNNQVSGLSDGAQKIGAVVDLINDIAGKTNLLALNATIEAARAGEAGRGFAVVAQEVKALAEQTAKATAQIAPQITLVQTSTEHAATAILGIGRTIEEINHIAAGIASAVEEQGAASEEIARNVHHAAEGTADVTRNIGGVQEAAQASSVAAEQVLSSAAELSKQTGNLRSEVDKFLRTVRAA
jgi:methyl-accepting chemotaxis protein